MEQNGSDGHIRVADLPAAPRVFEPTRIQEKHRMMFRLLAIGLKRAQVARVLNISTKTVSDWSLSALGKKAIEDIRTRLDTKAENVFDRLISLAPGAVDTLEGVLNEELDASIGQRIHAAEQVLDRAGFGAVKKIQTEGTHIRMTVDDIDRLKARAVSKGGMPIKDLQLCPQEAEIVEEEPTTLADTPQSS